MPDRNANKPMTPPARRLRALLLALVAGGASIPVSTSAAEFYDRALKRFRAADYRGAVIDLKNELQQQPESVSARLLLGQAYLELRDSYSARQELRQAQGAGADAALVIPLIAQTYFLERNYEGFLGDYPVPKSGKDAAVIHAARAEALLRVNLPAEAEREFAAAARAQPGNAGWRLGRARALLRLGRAAEAEQEVDAALEVAPMNAGVWYVKGELRRDAGDLQSALDHYSKALEYDARHAAAKMSRAVTAIQLGNPDTASRDKADLQLLFPNNPQVLYLESQLRRSAADEAGWRELMERAGVEFDALSPELVETDTFLLLLGGTIHYQLDHREKALQHLTRYVKFVPHHVRARLMLANIQLWNGAIDAAIETLEAVPASSAGDVDILATLGDAYHKAGRFGDSVRALEGATRAAPERADLRMALGLARAGAGQGDAAREDLRTALQMDSELLRASWALVHLDIDGGLVDEAYAIAQAAVSQYPDSAASHTLLGQAQIARRDLDAAIASLERAVAIDPSFTEARRRMARAWVLSDDLDRARAAYQEIVTEIPGDEESLTQLSLIAERSGSLDDAIAWLEQLRKHAGTGHSRMPDLVERYIAAGRGAEALELAIQLDNEQPVTPRLMMLLGRAFIVQKQPERAREVLKVPYGLLLKSPTGLLELARLQLQADAFDDARRSLDTVLETKVNFVPAQALYVELDIRSGNLDAALARAQKLRDQHAKLGLGDVLVADVHMAAGRYPQAIQSYDTALAKDSDWSVALRLYQARVAGGNIDAALAGLAEWVDAHPTDRGAASLLAVAYLENGDWENARRRHEELFARSPSDPQVLNNLAWIYWKTGDNRALAHAREAQRLAPDSVDALDTLGWILVDGGSLAEGMHYLREAHVRDSRLPGVSYHLAVALVGLNRPVEARELLEQSLRIGVSYPEREEAQALLQSIREK